jgi:hypothetical protein
MMCHFFQMNQVVEVEPVEEMLITELLPVGQATKTQIAV